MDWKKRVLRVLNRIPSGDRILVAVSGGKDSVFLAYALHSLGRNIELLFIDFDYPDYSDVCKKTVEKLSKILTIKLNVVSIWNYTKTSPAVKKPVCRFCGIAKRYIMNRFAYEHGFKWIATGHNMDDELAFFILDAASGNLDGFLRRRAIIPPKPEYKLVGKIKPLYYFEDREIKMLVRKFNLPVCTAVCPFEESTQNRAKRGIKCLDNELKIKRPLFAFLKKIRKMLPLEEPKLRLCKKCGYVSYGEVCSFCKYFT